MGTLGPNSGELNDPESGPFGQKETKFLVRTAALPQQQGAWRDGARARQLRSVASGRIRQLLEHVDSTPVVVWMPMVTVPDMMIMHHQESRKGTIPIDARLPP